MHLVFDFDGTITHEDTISELARSALAFQKSNGQDLEAEWEEVVQEYVNDLKRYHREYPVPEDERTSVGEELKFLSGLKEVEEMSLGRVSRSGVFKGLEEGLLRKAGTEAVQSGRVRIRDGFEEVLSLAERKGWSVGVISVNWSRSFIQGVLEPHNLDIMANELSQDGEIEGPEFLGCMLSNGCEKRQALRHITGEKQDKVLYFGDSTTDMECLIAGGVVISDKPESLLWQTMKRVGIELPHVGEREDEKVSWARNFREVLESGLL
ncbi:Fc.00g067270.m01.CDS01 [Cosmosporella sp. VM-42]